MAASGYLGFYFDAHVTPLYVNDSRPNNLTYSQRIDYLIQWNYITIDSGYVVKKFYSDSSYQNEVSPDTVWDPDTDVSVYVKVEPETMVNKVVYGDETLIDLTTDTVTANRVLNGYTTHDASGTKITGTCTFDADTHDANATASEIISGKSAYVQGSKVNGTMNNIGGQTGSISTKAQTVSISQGYHDGSGSVSIDATEQAKLVPENIADGVSILGITGTHSGTNITAGTGCEIDENDVLNVLVDNDTITINSDNKLTSALYETVEAETVDIPTKLSDFTNDVGFIKFDNEVGVTFLEGAEDWNTQTHLLKYGNIVFGSFSIRINTATCYQPLKVSVKPSSSIKVVLTSYASDGKSNTYLCVLRNSDGILRNTNSAGMAVGYYAGQVIYQTGD